MHQPNPQKLAADSVSQDAGDQPPLTIGEQMRVLEYERLGKEIHELLSDMRRLELASVVAVGAVAAFLLKENPPPEFRTLGAVIPVLITVTAGVRCWTYFEQLKRFGKHLALTETVLRHPEGWENKLDKLRTGTDDVIERRASRWANLSLIVFWAALLSFSIGFFAVVVTK